MLQILVKDKDFFFGGWWGGEGVGRGDLFWVGNLFLVDKIVGRNIAF